MNNNFWGYIDQLIKMSEIVIDRPQGTTHPNFPDFIYPVDYGYLKDTIAIDGGGVDVWQGTAGNKLVDAVICTVDLYKRDSEMKILYECTQEEKQKIHEVLNVKMGGLLVERNNVSELDP